MKTTRQIIAEYVERNDIHGLAEFARAMMEDQVLEKINNVEVLCHCGVVITTTDDAEKAFCHSCGSPIKLPNIKK